MPPRLLASSRLLPLALAAVLFAAGPARAFDGLEGARALGMANVLRANPSGASALTLNPSGMSLQPNFQIEADYAYGPQLGSHGLILAFADSTSAIKLAGGLSYSYLHQSPLDFRTNKPLLLVGHDLTIALSYPLGDYVSVGASGKFQKLTLSSDPRNDRRSGYDENHGNLDAGISVKFDPFRAAVVGQNVISAHNAAIPAILGIAASVGGTKETPYMVGADVAVDFTTWGGATARYSLGGEYVIKNIVGVRTGYTLDSGGGVRHYAHVGVSLTASKASFDVGLRQQANAEKETALGFALRIAVQ
jgi:hypothetical protein